MVTTNVYLVNYLDVFDDLRMVSKDVVNFVECFIILLNVSPGPSSGLWSYLVQPPGDFSCIS